MFSFDLVSSLRTNNKDNKFISIIIYGLLGNNFDELISFEIDSIDQGQYPDLEQ